MNYNGSRKIQKALRKNLETTRYICYMLFFYTCVYCYSWNFQNLVKQRKNTYICSSLPTTTTIYQCMNYYKPIINAILHTCGYLLPHHQVSNSVSLFYKRLMIFSKQLHNHLPIISCFCFQLYYLS